VRFAQAYFDTKPSQTRLYTALQSVLDRFQEASDEDQTEFWGALLQCVQIYAFLSQILPFAGHGRQQL
jgi:hypothetical protein